MRTANVFSGSTVRFRNLSFFGDYKFDWFPILAQIVWERTQNTELRCVTVLWQCCVSDNCPMYGWLDCPPRKIVFCHAMDCWDRPLLLSTTPRFLFVSGDTDIMSGQSGHQQNWNWNQIGCWYLSQLVVSRLISNNWQAQCLQIMKMWYFQQSLMGQNAFIKVSTNRPQQF